jgi:hypothetical protein
MQKYVEWKEGRVVAGPQSNPGGEGWLPYFPLINKEMGLDSKNVLSEDGLSVREVLYTHEHSFSTKRIIAYEAIEEQLDKLFHDIENGTLDKTGDFYTSIKKIKDSVPKP